MVTFKPVSFFEKGTTRRILMASYHDFFILFPDEKNKLILQWDQEEEEAFSDPIIEDYTRITCISDNPIGYFSWDGRQYPVGIIGQNCILPIHRGKGHGKKQIEFIIKIFQENKFNQINVITGDHDFFIPAQKMYASCGFREHRRMEGDLFNLIEFSRMI